MDSELKDFLDSKKEEIINSSDATKKSAAILSAHIMPIINLYNKIELSNPELARKVLVHIVEGAIVVCTSNLDEALSVAKEVNDAIVDAANEVSKR